MPQAIYAHSTYAQLGCHRLADTYAIPYKVKQQLTDATTDVTFLRLPRYRTIIVLADHPATTSR
jgi:hypothetical protein